MEDEEPADVLLCQESRGSSLGLGPAGARTNGADIAQARVPHRAVEISGRGRATHRDGIHVPVGDQRGKVHGNRGGAVIPEDAVKSPRRAYPRAIIIRHQHLECT